MKSTVLASPCSSQRVEFAPKHLVIVDRSVDAFEQLVSGFLHPDTDVELLDPTEDGVVAITRILQTRSDIASLHLISHGSVGSLQLGSAVLSRQTLPCYQPHIETWKRVLQERDLLIYGCNVAQGLTGRLFLQEIHELTGARIAASANKVGQFAYQQNWSLETTVGKVETDIVLSDAVRANYLGSFEQVNFRVTPSVVIENEGTEFSFLFDIDGQIPAGGSVVRLEGSIPQAINQWNLFALSFSGLAGQPVDVSPALDFSIFEVTITEPTADITLPIFNDFIDDSPQEVTWTVTPVSAGTTVNSGETTVTIFDDRSEVPTNNSPVATDDSYGTDFETELVVNEANGVLANDTDLDPGDNLSASLNASPTNGTLNLVANGSFTYTPNAGFAGNDSFTYEISDGNGGTDIGSVTIVVDGASNNPPTAGDDSYVTAFETILAVNAANGVLNGDSDPDGDSLEVLLEGAPSNGNLTLAGDGAFIYTPNTGFSGEDSFTYRVEDGRGGSDTATVTIIVDDDNSTGNGSPDALDDSYDTEFETELVVDAANGVLSNDTDPERDVLFASLIFDVTGGTVNLANDGSFTYIPDPGFSGTDSFTYSVNDGNGGIDVAAVEIVVAPNPIPITVGLTTSTDLLDASNTLIEDQGSILTINFSLDTAAATGGLSLFLDNDISGILNRLDFDEFAQNPQVQGIDPDSISLDSDRSGFVVTVDAGVTAASLSIPIFDNIEPNPLLPEVLDGVVDSLFSLKTASEITAEDGIDPLLLGNYISDADANSSEVIFADTARQLQGLPSEGEVFEGDFVDLNLVRNSRDRISQLVYNSTDSITGSFNVLLTNNVGSASRAAFDNLVGFYSVVDVNGGVDSDGDGLADLAPGDDGYARAALTNQIDDLSIRAGSGPNTSSEAFGNVLLERGQLFAPFIISNAAGLSVEEFLALNPTNDAARSSGDRVAYFAFSAANPDGVDHLRYLGNNTFGFEDLPFNLGVSDNDFNDAIFQLGFTA
ncbi:MAG: Ig-like domain-containing protein [Cyanobacteria bacterium P01_H01_bin.15]